MSSEPKFRPGDVVFWQLYAWDQTLGCYVAVSSFEQRYVVLNSFAAAASYNYCLTDFSDEASYIWYATEESLRLDAEVTLIRAAERASRGADVRAKIQGG